MFEQSFPKGFAIRLAFLDFAVQIPDGNDGEGHGQALACHLIKHVRDELFHKIPLLFLGSLCRRSERRGSGGSLRSRLAHAFLAAGCDALAFGVDVGVESLFHRQFQRLRLAAFRVGLPLASFMGPGIPLILAQKDFFRAASALVLGFGAGALRLLPVSRLYLALPLAVRPAPLDTGSFSPRPTDRDVDLRGIFRQVSLKLLDLATSMVTVAICPCLCLVYELNPAIWMNNAVDCSHLLKEWRCWSHFEIHKIDVCDHRRSNRRRAVDVCEEKYASRRDVGGVRCYG